MASKSSYLKGKAIAAHPIGSDVGIVELVDSYFQAYNEGRLREACRLFAKHFGNRLNFDTLADVNETASIVFDTKRSGGKSAVLVFGGGSPKNFILQTEPQIQEVLGIDEKGHDYFIQITDARPDTGGLSGATPSEAVSWRKIDPDKLPDTVVAYIDSTVAMPIMTSYALARHKPRKLKRLFDKRVKNMEGLKKEYFRVKDKRKYST